MSESILVSAEIIPFPHRLPERDGKARLSEALASLQKALSEQQQAIAAWRGAVGELRESVHRLGGSLSDYQVELVRLNSKVGTLNSSSRQLQDWVERAGTTASS